MRGKVAKMLIEVLCMSCGTHLLDTTIEALDWPMEASMFTPKYPGFYLRQGLLDLEYFCPACQMFPFSHDPYLSGAKAVGKLLNVRGSDGKPQVLSIKQILMGDNFRAEPALTPVNGGQAQPGQSTTDLEPPTQGSHVDERGVVLGTSSTSPSQNPQGLAPGEAIPAFPCPSCGAKKRFHKKGCVTQATEEDKAKQPIMVEVIQKQVFSDPHLLAMEGRVSSGPERSEMPTIDDLKDLERDRERRASGRPEPELRPGEGYAPPVMR